MKPICFYHSADLDGLCSGAIMARAMPDAEMRPFDYGDEFPWAEVEGREVHMADVSLQPGEDMVRLASVAAKLTWCDHHKSAIESWHKLGDVWCLPGRRSTELAACELCWQHYFPHDTMPQAVFLLGRYDVWQWKVIPEALPFQFGMRLDDWTDVRSNRWRAFFSGVVNDDIVAAGRTVLQYQKQQNKIRARACCFETALDGLRLIACNQGPTNSQLFDSIWDPGKYDAMAPFYMRKDGRWTVSLYSDKPDVDCSAVAKARGGGGHKGAAGFQCDELPFAIKRSSLI